MTERAIPVPQRLASPHPFIVATREAAKGLKPREDGRLDIGRRQGLIHLVVSRPLVPRALRIAQAIIDEAERRAYGLEQVEGSYNHAAGVGIALKGETYAFMLSELVDRVPLTEADLERWRRENEHRFRWRLSGDEPKPPRTKPVANGRLQLSLEHSYGSGQQSNWSEGPRVGSLEERLPAFFVGLEARAEKDCQRAAAWARERAEAERRAEELRERQRLAQIEELRCQRLAGEATAWRQARDMRVYLAELRKRLVDIEPEERERVAAWCDWAEAHVERSDPVQNTARIHGFDDEQDGRVTHRSW